MKTIATVLLTLFFILGSLTFVPLQVLVDTLSDTERFVELTKDAQLYDRSIHRSVKRIMRTDAMLSLRETAVEIREKEVDSILRLTFPENWFLGEVKRLHSEAAAFLASDKPEKPDVAVHLQEKKNEMLQRTLSLARAKLESLDECTTSDLRKLRTAPPDLAAIKCRPPQHIIDQLMAGFRQSVGPVTEAIPSVLYLPGFYPQTVKSTLMMQIGSAYRLLNAMSTISMIVLLLALALIFYLHWPDLAKGLVRTGLPLLLAGIILLLLAFPVQWIVSNIVDIPSLAGRFEVDVTNSPFGHDIMQAETRLAISFISFYFHELTKIGVFILVAGVLLVIGGRMQKGAPAAQQ